MSFAKRLLMSAAAAVMVSGTAFGADLLRSQPAPPPAPYVPPPPVFTWTGFYIGANAGAAFGNTNNGSVAAYDFPTEAPGTGYISTVNNNARFTGGGQIGYNWQAGPMVFGLEADFDYLGNNSNTGVVVPDGAPLPYFVAVRGNNGNFLGTVRGRLGYAVDRALFYVTGGLAYGSNGSPGSVTYFPGDGGPYTYLSSGNHSNVGYAVGGGLEYAFTPHWTGRVEYLFVDRGNKDTAYLAPVGAPPGSYFTINNRNRDNIVRVGLNYKF